ncbi:hypothetical protein DRN32_01735 [Thermococci archaeon]|nr:MAG: hypothetical protein DRN32_01735 [Thermococci archaeon]
MKVDRFEIKRGVTGVTVRVEVSTEVKVKFDVLVHREIVVGFNYDDDRKLEGEEGFTELRFKTPDLESLDQAELCALEIKAILAEVKRRERIELERLRKVEDYLREEFEGFVTE